MTEYKFTVEILKTRLDKYLAEQLKDVSRSQIQRDIEAGCVLVNGEKVLEGKHVVRKDNFVEYHQPEQKEEGLQPTNTPLKVLYNNHGLIVIDKPAGLTVHPGAGFKGETLASALLYHFKDIYVVGEDHRPGIVHRLDKDTSGVMLVAATQEMYEYLKNAFAERKIKKEYIALVYGKVEKPHGFIETPIGRSKRDFRKYGVKDMIEPKQSLTEYQVLEYLDLPSPALRAPSPQRGREIRLGGSVDTATLLLVKLHTGRTHQIRVHMSSIGHPLMGDLLYGNKKTQISGLFRQFLHAKKIEVQLPDRTWIEAESELSEDLKEVLRKLNSNFINQL